MVNSGRDCVVTNSPHSSTHQSASSRTRALWAFIVYGRQAISAHPRLPPHLIATLPTEPFSCLLSVNRYIPLVPLKLVATNIMHHIGALVCVSHCEIAYHNVKRLGARLCGVSAYLHHAPMWCAPVSTHLLSAPHWCIDCVGYSARQGAGLCANVSRSSMLSLVGCCLYTTYPNLGPVRRPAAGGPIDHEFCIIPCKNPFF